MKDEKTQAPEAAAADILVDRFARALESGELARLVEATIPEEIEGHRTSLDHGSSDQRRDQSRREPRRRT